MNKAMVGLATGIVVVGAAAVGGGMYADQKIRQLYDSESTISQSDKRVKLRNSQLDLGLTGGSAKWTVDFIPDLCSPDQKMLTLRGEDEIKRSLSGYNIVSKIYYVGEDGKEVFLLNADSNSTWSGGLTTRITMPAGSHALDGQTHAKWAEATGKVSLSLEKDRYVMDTYEFSFPEISIGDNGSNEFKMQGLRYEGNTSLQTGLIRNGKEESKIDKISVKFQNTQLELNKLASVTRVDGGEKVSVSSENSAENLILDGKTYTNIRLNGAIKLDKAVLEKAVELINRQSQTCVKLNEMESEFKDLVLQALQKGIELETKGNQIELEGSKVTFDASGSFPAGSYTEEDLSKRFAELMKYQANLRIDKAFVQKTGLADKGVKIPSDDELRQMAKDLPPNVKLDITAEAVTVSTSKQ